VLTPLDAPSLHLAVAVAGPSSTAAAYAALHDDERHGDGRAARLAHAFNTGDRASASDQREPTHAAAPPRDAPGQRTRSEARQTHRSEDAAQRSRSEDDRQAHRIDGAPYRPPIEDALLGSALEPPACRAAPGLAASLARLRATTPGHPWHLTGSGGAAFALAADAAHAAALAAAARNAGFAARACRTLPGRHAPQHIAGSAR